MRFARLGEDAVLRSHELTGEEFRLYTYILFHTFADTGICRMSVREISVLYSVNYNHTTERFKILRRKGWCKKEKAGIRPLVGLKTPKIGVNNSENRSTELQKTEYKTPENGVLNNEKLQKSELPFPYIEPLKPEPLNTHTENGVRANSGKEHKSVFSLEECIRYAEISKAAGENIKSPKALGKALYESGEFDSFIQATLYPMGTAEPPANDKLADALKMLLEIEAEGDDVGDFKKWYTEDEWQWLMSELAK